MNVRIDLLAFISRGSKSKSRAAARAKVVLPIPAVPVKNIHPLYGLLFNYFVRMRFGSSCPIISSNVSGLCVSHNILVKIQTVLCKGYYNGKDSL